MAKAIRLYTGTDSFGGRVELAERADNQWFVRYQEKTQWGYSWTKWKLHVSKVVHPEKVLNGSEYYNAPEYIEIPKENQHLYVDWGFKTLRFQQASEKGYGLRLPK